MTRLTELLEALSQQGFQGVHADAPARAAPQFRSRILKPVLTPAPLLLPAGKHKGERSRFAFPA
jgi:hypothetical protein